MTRHLLVTNDFPPKVGGIQQYLWELWRRLDPSTFEVHTTPHRAAEEFDAEQSFSIRRSSEPVLLPYPWLPARLDAAARRFDAELVVIDPAVPLGLVGASLERPYVVVLHGAEVTVPGRLPISRSALARVLDRATGVISAGQYALNEAERAVGRSLQSVVIPPGVDVDRYRPIAAHERDRIRAKYGIAADAPFVLSVSRLVPRKGMDSLVAVASRLQRSYPDLVVAIAGAGRDHARLQRRIDALDAPVRLLGRVPEEDKASLYASSDVFAMLCRSRWGGLEQEGFGIVFLEAAAAGIPQLAGDSGGAAEAVAHGETGLIVAPDATIGDTTEALDSLLSDSTRREAMGAAARVRAVTTFDYDVLAQRLAETLAAWRL